MCIRDSSLTHSLTHSLNYSLTPSRSPFSLPSLSASVPLFHLLGRAKEGARHSLLGPACCFISTPCPSIPPSPFLTPNSACACWVQVAARGRPGPPRYLAAPRNQTHPTVPRAKSNTTNHTTRKKLPVQHINAPRFHNHLAIARRARDAVAPVACI
eukprot:286700-Rhodomonas_salina.1